MGYKVGVAKRDITPPVGIKMCGFAARTESSTGVYHPLQATAVVIDDGVTPVLIVGVDILGFYDRSDAVREALSAALDLPRSAILLAGSHTHCGPHIRDFDTPRLGPPSPEYRGLLIRRIVEAAQAAWAGRADAVLKAGTGTCTFAASRRRLRPDGLVEWGPDRSAPHDHDVPVLTATRANGDVACVLYGYACHPTSRAGLLIGGDYVSFAHDRIEELFPGAAACFLQGCGADQKPWPVDPEATTFVQREVHEVKWLGDELGDAVAAVVRGGGMAELSGSVTAQSRTIDLISIPPDIDDARAVLAGPDQRIKAWAEMIVDAVENDRALERRVPFEVQTLTLGRSLCFVALAGEITVEHGLRLKRDLASQFDHVVPVGYANHIVGYVPVKRQIPEGGYCVEWANKFHDRTGRWVDETEEQIHRTIGEMLTACARAPGRP